MSKLIVSLLFLAGVLESAPGAFADTIIASTGTAQAEFTLGGTTNQVQIAEVSWTALGSYSNVSIAAEVSNASEANSSISAYLTTAIGPSETVANQIAGFTFTPATSDEVDTLFSGLNLGPGTYYLVLTGGYSNSTLAGWLGTDTANGATTGTGVTFNGDGFANGSLGTPNTANPPASTFRSLDDGLLFQVTGQAASASPEPGSMSLILTSLLAGCWLWKRGRFSLKRF